MCNSIKPTLEVIHPAWEQTILHDCVCLWERHPSACALLSGELISPIPGMSRHSQGKHSRFNYKLQRGLVCAALCVSVRLWEWGRHKGREWQKVSPSFPALKNKTGAHTHTAVSPGLCEVLSVYFFILVVRARVGSSGCHLWGNTGRAK